MAAVTIHVDLSAVHAGLSYLTDAICRAQSGSWLPSESRDAALQLLGDFISEPGVLRGDLLINTVASPAAGTNDFVARAHLGPRFLDLIAAVRAVDPNFHDSPPSSSE